MSSICDMILFCKLCYDNFDSFITATFNLRSNTTRDRRNNLSKLLCNIDATKFILPVELQIYGTMCLSLFFLHLQLLFFRKRLLVVVMLSLESCLDPKTKSCSIFYVLVLVLRAQVFVFSLEVWSNSRPI